MQMFTDFRLQQQQKEMRAQNSPVDQTQAGGSEGREFDKEKEKAGGRLKETEGETGGLKQRERYANAHRLCNEKSPY